MPQHGNHGVLTAGPPGKSLESFLEHLVVPGGSMVKNLSAIQQTLVQSPDWEYPLKKEMATHSNIFSWEILWTEEPGGLQKSQTRLSD